jgi:hypothetical protein
VYIYCVVCEFFKTMECAVLLTSDVQVAPLSRKSIVKIPCFANSCIENYFKPNIYIYIYILIRKLEPSFLLLLRHILKHNLSYMLGYVERDRSWCIHRGRTCRTDHLTLNLAEISIFEDILLHLI